MQEVVAKTVSITRGNSSSKECQVLEQSLLDSLGPTQVKSGTKEREVLLTTNTYTF